MRESRRSAFIVGEVHEQSLATDSQMEERVVEEYNPVCRPITVHSFTATPQTRDFIDTQRQLQIVSAGYVPRIYRLYRALGRQARSREQLICQPRLWLRSVRSI